MKYKYKFPIGDWSGDGHEKCNWFVAQGEKPVEDLREVHFKCEEVLGFDIGDMCRKYEEGRIKDDILEKLESAEIIKKDDHVFGEKFEFGSQELFVLWLKILNHIDPELKLESIPENLPCINFYGFDDKERHLYTPGYGIV